MVVVVRYTLQLRYDLWRILRLRVIEFMDTNNTGETLLQAGYSKRSMAPFLKSSQCNIKLRGTIRQNSNKIKYTHMIAAHSTEISPLDDRDIIHL